MGRRYSLKNGLVLTMILCWLMPILILMSLAGILFGRSYHKNIRQEVNQATEYAMSQIEKDIDAMIQDSKAVSYDGIIRNAYRKYGEDGDRAALYRSTNDYLNQNFSRSTEYQAVLIHFWDEGIGFSASCMTSGTNSRNLLNRLREDTDNILEEMADADTAIRFLPVSNHLYMARNLLDTNFQPYASVVMLIDVSNLLHSLDLIHRIEHGCFLLDEAVCLGETRQILRMDETEENVIREDISYTVSMEDHTLEFHADMIPYDILRENSNLILAALGAALLVLPLLLILIYLFYVHVTRPMENLVQANQRVQSGERGYEIQEVAPNMEFEDLYRHFNEMSTELQRQFVRSYEEQRATQKAQIKALQSQINPHFLNNTLEIINWEARIAGNEKICDMLEALSTMLGAALDRDGRTQIPLKEELGYVNAYLFITGERLGGALDVQWEIPEEMHKKMVPRLILQPIVENAVEHDIAPNRGGRMIVRTSCTDQRMVLEVEHDGTLTMEDQEKIRELLAAAEPGKRNVGLRNVSRRLKLLYGDAGHMSMEATDHGTVLATIAFPLDL